jgi:DNA polymerase III epsilon subunit-like protein
MNNNNILIFDLETIGFPKYKNAKPFQTYYYDQARIIEIGYVIINPNGEVLKSVNHFVKYDKTINIENSFIHGITNDMVMEHGVMIDYVLDELTDDLINVDTIVAHNIEFDYNVLLSEVYRKYKNFKHLLGLLYSKDLHCTMQIGKKLMVSGKYPKLVELHQLLFNKVWVQTHRALDDVNTCAKCYIEMMKLNKIK